MFACRLEWMLCLQQLVSKVEVTVRLLQEVNKVAKNLHSVISVTSVAQSIKVGVVIIICIIASIDLTLCWTKWRHTLYEYPLVREENLALLLTVQFLSLGVIMFLKQSLKQFLAILACCSVPIITYFVSTVIVHAQVANDELKDLDSDE